MLVPLSWLKEYVDIDVTPQELEKKLFDGGFEVEELYQVGHDIDKIVVGLVETCEPIPETHLHVCQVNAGEYGTMQICCGADNVQAGGKYPVALVGATVYATAKDHKTIEGVMTIKKGKLRGFESYGMLCSGTELGLTEDLYPGAGYNGLLEMPADAQPGADVKAITGLDDWMFDISLTANRPDCQSILGIAREVSAMLEKPLKMPSTDYTETDVKKDGFKVSVEAPDLCPRYSAHYVYDVKMGESPAWMKRRLALVGIGSISNIVDITNYVLKEIGQPMHAFDCSYLEGNEICVRRAHEGEKIVTLDEQEYTMSPANLVICDGVKPVALAGVMGGLNSEIRDTTESVMFEAAKFARDNVRKTARALGKSSDSSSRFEKGVDEYSTVLGMKRALHLIEELGCGKVSSTHVDVNVGNSIEPQPMQVSIHKVNSVLGIEVPAEGIVRLMKNLNFNPTIDGDVLTLQVPAYREDMLPEGENDVERYPDVAEEVIRMYGYDHIKSTFMPSAQVTAGGYNKEQKGEFLAIVKGTLRKLADQGINRKSLLAGMNYFEFKYREADYGSAPKGLMYGLQCLDSWLYDGDPMTHLCYQETFDFLKKEVENGYFEQLIKDYLLDNPFEAVIVVAPEKNLTAKEDEKLAKKLADYKASLSEEELEKLVKATRELKEYQDTPSTPEILAKIPLLTREDIDKKAETFVWTAKEEDGIKVLHHNFFTSGIGYLKILFNTSVLPQEDLPYAGLLKSVLGSISTEH